MSDLDTPQGSETLSGAWAGRFAATRRTLIQVQSQTLGSLSAADEDVDRRPAGGGCTQSQARGLRRCVSGVGWWGSKGLDISYEFEN